VKGFIYIALNPLISGMVKIGFSSRDPNYRLSELNGTNSPADFQLAYFALVEDAEKVERLVHGQLKDCRYRSNREFFSVGVHEAVRCILENCDGALYEEFAESGILDPDMESGSRSRLPGETIEEFHERQRRLMYETIRRGN
jgi:hypothetical protein